MAEAAGRHRKEELTRSPRVASPLLLLLLGRRAMWEGATRRRCAASRREGPVVSRRGGTAVRGGRLVVVLLVLVFLFARTRHLLLRSCAQTLHKLFEFQLPSSLLLTLDTSRSNRLGLASAAAPHLWSTSASEHRSSPFPYASGCSQVCIHRLDSIQRLHSKAAFIVSYSFIVS